MAKDVRRTIVREQGGRTEDGHECRKYGGNRSYVREHHTELRSDAGVRRRSWRYLRRLADRVRRRALRAQSSGWACRHITSVGRSCMTGSYIACQTLAHPSFFLHKDIGGSAIGAMLWQLLGRIQGDGAGRIDMGNRIGDSVEFVVLGKPKDQPKYT